jgi:rRNA maturation RNase YbeY
LSIGITISDGRFRLDKKALGALARAILDRESAPGHSLDLVYCRDRDIIPLNRRFKKHKTSTDVLSFNLGDSRKDSYLGEIYVNLQMARRQAREFGVSYSEEVKRLTVHGVLHLLGYRDDTSKSRARMWSRQENYLLK